MATGTTHFDFSDSTVLITGAAGGLGSGLALAFAKAGARLVLHYRGPKDRVEALAASLPGGRGHLLLCAEATDEASVDKALADLGRQGVLLDVLVNNAGTYPNAPIPELGAKDFRAVLDASLLAAHLFSKAALALMAPGARIVNIASVEAERPALGHAHYGAAKAALVAYTKSQALELASRGIRANCLSPGLIDREGLADAWPQGLRSWNRACPLARPGTAEEVAKACLFLASDASSWISGANLVVDGGASARPPQDPN